MDGYPKVIAVITTANDGCFWKLEGPNIIYSTDDMATIFPENMINTDFMALYLWAD